VHAELNVNSWDQCYAPADYYFGTEPNDLLLQHFSVIRRGGDVLCLAEGEGRNAVFLAHEGYRVVAVDQSAVGLQKAERLAATKGAQIQTVVADLSDYRIEPSHWDGIVSIWCHLPRSLQVAVHRQVVAGLKPGGVFVLEAYTPAQFGCGTGGPSTADLMLTLPELRRELKGLDLVHALERERVVHEGSGHDGLSAVVQIIARKRL
jgi:SAM-dependent methyltransferase